MLLFSQQSLLSGKKGHWPVWAALSAVIAGGLAGCTADPNMGSVITVTGPQLSIQYENNPLRQMSKQQWYEKGFGILEVSADDGTTLSLAVADHDAATDVITFLAQDQRRLLTFNGRIVASVGFLNDLAELSTLGPNPFKRGNFDDFTTRSVQWRLTERSGQLPLRALSRYTIERPTTVPIAGALHHVRQISEDWWIPELGWRETNYYWVNTQGIVLMSEQSLYPGFPRLHTTFWSRALVSTTHAE